MQPRNRAVELFDQAVSLQALGRDADAVASYDRALALAPGIPEALNNRGNALRRLGRKEEALASYDEALRSKPGYAPALNNRGTVLQDLGRNAEALDAYAQALALDPRNPEILYNRGTVLRALGRYDEALESYDASLALRPAHAQALRNRGNALSALGRMEDAIASYRRCLELDPRDATAHSSLIFALARCSSDNAAIHAHAKRFADTFESGVRRLAHANDRHAERRLRIGYVSGDFRDHPIAGFIRPVLARHDRRKVEVFCYSNAEHGDRETARLKALADHWREIGGCDDDAAAEQVRSDAIDVLVDLSGHTSGNRLLMFARKPAPVQVAWLGMPGTTGLSAIDYRLTNPYVDAVGVTERFYSEELYRLPMSAAFEPVQDAPPPGPLPALANGHVTFASFNDTTKLTPAVFALWSKLLHAAPGSRLVMICRAHAKRGAAAEFAAHGIAAERLTFHERLPLRDYLALHERIDIALDPFPYNGGTVTRHALWMGVPVVTLAGSTPVSRVGLALLSQAGLESWVAESPEAYVEIALRKAGDLAGLSQLRSTLRERVRNAPFADARAFTRELEAAYRAMWRRFLERA